MIVQPLAALRRLVWRRRGQLSLLFRRRSGLEFTGQHVAIVGLFSSRSGLGRAAELLALGLEYEGHAVRRLDATDMLNCGDATSGYEKFAGDPLAETQAIVFVLNPPWLSRALARLSAPWHRSHPVVAHVVYELDRAPRWWAGPLRRCDEIWVPSELTRQAILSLGRNESRTSKMAMPEIMTPKLKPYPVALDPFPLIAPEERQAARQELGLPPRSTCFGFSFATQSSFERKNPLMLLRAYLSAFPAPDTHETCLLIRVSDANRDDICSKKLIAAVQERQDIRIITRDQRIGIRPFYAALDCYVSPHRSEGFGFNLFEARQCGLALIATAHGLDAALRADDEVTSIPFASVPVVDPQGLYDSDPAVRWAEPDFEALVRALQNEAHRIPRCAGFPDQAG